MSVPPVAPFVLNVRVPLSALNVYETDSSTWKYLVDSEELEGLGKARVATFRD